MNFKKLAITGASAALLLSSAIPAFAHGVDIDNHAHVNNNVTTQANTGFNSISGGGGHHGHGHGGVSNSNINTGNAGALSDVSNLVNSNVVDLCGCSGRVDIDNDARVTNNVTTQANTGFNSISGRRVRNSDINTGGAGAESWVSNVVNTNVLGSLPEPE